MKQNSGQTALFTALSSLISLAAGFGIWSLLSNLAAASPWLIIPVATLTTATVLLYMLHASAQAGHIAGIAAAETDSATKLPSSTVARHLLRREFAAAERGRKLSIVLFSFDNLPRMMAIKPLEADRVLLGVGAILKRRTRGMNLSARLDDGHTFISVLGGVDEEGAEKFVSKVTKDLVTLKAAGQPVLLRAGVASYDPEMHTVDDLVAKAHASLIEPGTEADGLLIA